MKPVYVTDIIGEVVAKTMDSTIGSKTLLETIQDNEAEAQESSSLIQTIDYQYGHKRELIETLFQMDKSSEERELKYPLLYLVQDFTEDRGKASGVYAEVNLNIIIAHHTPEKGKLKIGKRMERVFKPVLYPIYYAFMEQLAKHKLIHEADASMIRHKKTDRSYWGRMAVGGNDANKLNDYVDAIELENLHLKILFNNC